MLDGSIGRTEVTAEKGAWRDHITAEKGAWRGHVTAEKGAWRDDTTAATGVHVGMMEDGIRTAKVAGIGATVENGAWTNTNLMKSIKNIAQIFQIIEDGAVLRKGRSQKTRKFSLDSGSTSENE